MHKMGEERRDSEGAYLHLEHLLRFFISIAVAQKSHCPVPMVEEKT